MISLKINSSTSSDTLSVHERRTAYEPKKTIKRIKLDKKYSAEQIAEMLELNVADVEKIIKELQKN